MRGLFDGPRIFAAVGWGSVSIRTFTHLRLTAFIHG